MNSAAVERYMTKFPVLARPEMTSAEALQLMKTFHIRHLPVVEDHEILGVVSQRDLYRANSLGSYTENPVAAVMTKDPYVVRTGTPLSEVTRKMATEKYGSTVVVDSVGDVLGIFTTTDALRMLTWYLTEEERLDESRSERLIEEWFEWDASLGE